MRTLLVAGLVTGLMTCAAPVAEAWPKIGNCRMPPDRKGAKLIGCLADAPSWSNVDCYYLTDGGQFFTMSTKVCGEWITTTGTGNLDIEDHRL